uniref:Peptidase A2 domain-containing protein n=1 Tax=Photinus pyralis TaxID=7054 RepID=A0A1Y1KP82_PHOPY
MISALIDTGSARTYFGASVKNILNRNQIYPTSLAQGTAEMADGTTVETMGNFQFQVIIADQSWMVNAIHLPTLNVDFILGLDFLGTYQARIDLRKGSLELGGGSQVTRQKSTGEVEAPDHSRIAGISSPNAAKLSRKYSGPYRVSKIISPVIVELQDLGNPRRKSRVHVKELKAIPSSDDEESQGGKLLVKAQSRQESSPVLQPLRWHQ